MMYEYQAEVRSVRSDGTVVLDVDLGFGYREKLPFHYASIAIPHDHQTQVADLVRAELPKGQRVIINSTRLPSGEYAATIYVEGQAMNINDLIVSEGLATQPMGMHKGKT